MKNLLAELEPCPFCGKRDELEIVNEEFYQSRSIVVWYVHCKECDAKGPLIEAAGAEGAAILWNWRRA